MTAKQVCYLPGCGAPAKTGRREGRPLCDRHYKRLVRALAKRNPVFQATEKAKTVRKLNRKAAKVLSNILTNLNALIDAYAEASTKSDEILADLRTMQSACGALRPLHDMAMERMMGNADADLEVNHAAA
jgi:hypothetical protein